MQKRVLTIHDVSCVGRCSLTVALPILSAAGFETSVLPTALLSTHTGEFTGYTSLDLTEEMRKIYHHFLTLPLHFDALYSGFLGSYEQIGLVEEIFHTYHRRDTLLLVDPVMADHGRLYATYTQSMAEGMGRLCHMADVIVPNLTEASILLGESFDPAPSEARVSQMLRDLCRKFACRVAIITGVTQRGLLGAAAYDSSSEVSCFSGHPPFDGVFYGTGDVLASALLAALLHGMTLQRAVATAVEFTCAAMGHTLQNGLPLRYGVAFEQALPLLLDRLELTSGPPADPACSQSIL